MNDYYKQKAEENKVTGFKSFIDEMIYKWKSNPYLGGLPEKPTVGGDMFNTIKSFWNMPLMKIRLGKNSNSENNPKQVFPQ